MNESVSTSLPAALDRVNIDQNNSESLHAPLATVEQRHYVQGGTNNRQIIAGTIGHYHEAPQQAPAPLPKHTLPFTRDEGFVERLELAQLEKKLSRPGARIALHGLGGVGKSQLAIEICYRKRDSSPSTWVLWIHASNAARFDQDIRKLADDVQIPGRDEPSADIFRLVYNWLMHGSQPWLIVLDNADDVDYLLEIPSPSDQNIVESFPRPRIEYLPICDHGAILITSRRRDVAFKMVGQAHSMELAPDKEHAMSLIRRGLTRVDDADAIEKLASALDYMPLAIAQATAYIRKQHPRCTLEKYISMMEENNEHKIQLLSCGSRTTRQDVREASGAILLTWQISMDQIESSNRAAADLLSLMSFYNHQGIPDCLLDATNVGWTTQDAPDLAEASQSSTERSKPKPTKKRIRELFKHLFKQSSDRHNHLKHTPDTSHVDRSSNETQAASLEDCISILRDYSFVSMSPDGSTFEMHRLVQLATQGWLKHKGLLDRWEKQSLRRLNAAYPEPDDNDWEQCRALQPHAKLLLQAKITHEDALLVLASILFKALFYSAVQGAYMEAEAMSRRSLDIRRGILGNEHLDTLDAMDCFGEFLTDLGKYEDAEAVLEESLRTRELILGRDHQKTLVTVGGLGINRLLQRDLDGAEQLFRRALKGWTSMFGDHHPNTLRSLGNLSNVLHSQEKYEEAEAINRRVLEWTEEMLGKEHSQTLRSVYTLAMVLLDQGKYEEAGRLLRYALDKHEKRLGEEHPNTLLCVYNVARLHEKQGDDDIALQLYQRAAAGFLKTLGPSHPHTVDLQKALTNFQMHITTTKQANHNS